ncbi:MAG: hypothetical protein PWP76_356 [Candidatus Diapherotrites archaeon]|nr:hypothetical protein [Candidatus Diapherotrites archaeon]MDN5367217.1 hypothetical protein [Candidatus Diapherotrites archaeon]
MLSEIFVEFPQRVFHVPAEKKHEAETKKDLGNCTVLPAMSPEMAGAVRIKFKTGGKGARDFSRLPVETGTAVLERLVSISEQLGRSYWITGDFGWLVKGKDKLTFSIFPDPWHVVEDFVEETEGRRRFDPLTDAIMDGVKKWDRFYVRYGDAHMTGAVMHGDRLTDFVQLKRLIGSMRTQYGKMREVLYQQRRALLERGQMPSIGYHVLTINYNEPQIVVIPRVFVPRKGTWKAIELLYNARIVRDLKGEAAEQFWETHKEVVGEIIKAIK